MALLLFGEITFLEKSQLVELRKGKLKNGKATGKHEITGEMIKGELTGWWILSGGYIIWPLRVELCLKIGDLL